MINEKKVALELLDNGLTIDVSFKRAIFTLAKYLKHIGKTKEENRNVLLEWLKKQKCTISFETVLEGLDKSIDDVYKKDYKLFCDFNIEIYQNEIDKIKTLRSKGDKFIAFSLLCLSKIYGDEFFCYHMTLHKLTNISIRQIKRIIKRLEEDDFLKIISNNKTKKIIENKNGINKRYSHPNTYLINIEHDNIVFIIKELDNIKDIFNEYIK